jgi:polar amino acid transport system substrate-binding protein
MIYKFFALSLICFCLVGCEKSSQNEGLKPITVILSPDNPPYEFKDTDQGNGQVLGFDVDIIKELGKRLGRPIEIIEADFGAIIPSLQSGRADIAISELNPTEERKKSVDFSNPYYVDKSSFLVLESSTLTSEKDLAGQKLGVQLGTTNEASAKEWAKNIPNLTIVTLGKLGELVQELKNGRIQAILNAEKGCQNIAHATSGLKVVSTDIKGRELSVAFPKGSPLVGPVNDALKQMTDVIQTFENKWIKS